MSNTVFSCESDVTVYVLFQRYYYYIHHGIDTEHVAPMEDSWLENVLNLVANELKVGFTCTVIIIIPFVS